jgi:hypothetical protein
VHRCGQGAAPGLGALAYRIGRRVGRTPAVVALCVASDGTIPNRPRWYRRGASAYSTASAALTFRFFGRWLVLTCTSAVFYINSRKKVASDTSSAQQRCGKNAMSVNEKLRCRSQIFKIRKSQPLGFTCLNHGRGRGAEPHVSSLFSSITQ